MVSILSKCQWTAVQISWKTTYENLKVGSKNQNKPKLGPDKYQVLIKAFMKLQWGAKSHNSKLSH